jgi:hypothetical protein
MKGCIHDYSDQEDKCDCIVGHTNTADAGMPHTSLIQYIAQLERERNALRVQLTATLAERNVFAKRSRIFQSAAS